MRSSHRGLTRARERAGPGTGPRTAVGEGRGTEEPIETAKVASVDVGGQCGHRMLSGDTGQSVGQGAVKEKDGCRGTWCLKDEWGEEVAMGPDLPAHQGHGYRVTLESTL